MGHYIYKSIPTAKFEVDSFSSSEDMTSQNFPWKKGTSREIWLFTPKTVSTFSKMCFNFSNFQAEKNFLIFKIFGTSQADD